MTAKTGRKFAVDATARCFSRRGRMARFVCTVAGKEYANHVSVSYLHSKKIRIDSLTTDDENALSASIV